MEKQFFQKVKTGLGTHWGESALGKKPLPPRQRERSNKTDIYRFFLANPQVPNLDWTASVLVQSPPRRMNYEWDPMGQRTLVWRWEATRREKPVSPWQTLSSPHLSLCDSSTAVTQDQRLYVDWTPGCLRVPEPASCPSPPGPNWSSPLECCHTHDVATKRLSGKLTCPSSEREICQRSCHNAQGIHWLTVLWAPAVQGSWSETFTVSLDFL